MPTFAPVPEGQGQGAQYDNRPFSSGPYKIESYDRGKKLVLVPQHQLGRLDRPGAQGVPGQAGRGDGPARPNQIDDRLIASQGADASAVSWGDAAAARAPPRCCPTPEVQGAPDRRVDQLHGHGPDAHRPGPVQRCEGPSGRAVRARQGPCSPPRAAPPSTTCPPPTCRPTLFAGKQPDTLKIPATGDVEKAKQLLKEAGQAGRVRDEDDRLHRGQGAGRGDPAVAGQGRDQGHHRDRRPVGVLRDDRRHQEPHRHRVHGLVPRLPVRLHLPAVRLRRPLHQGEGQLRQPLALPRRGRP